eukprot:CAMPEP_0204872408 /NCGR_PEP_ID=MMETSP1348-20121228/38210_1 /ASSEMBLY_ACC=CAM_ASM_000700 /TAXON_ID=215587 /ORGANISM="Aplanochytrium stocchinoi, Strain GSBS06" /LENGTH=231 /DNA_ID=CAMNT_0052027279 /DNA_START=158 /DNA_END=853 /DNA_ORIENTATION=+
MNSLVIGKLEYKGLLSVTVVQATGLKRKRLKENTLAHIALYSPYVALELGKRHVHTAYRKHTLDPVWNESPKYNQLLNIPWNGKDELRVSLWSYEPLKKDELLGRAIVDIHVLVKLKREEGVKKWLKLFTKVKTKPCKCRDDQTSTITDDSTTGTMTDDATIDESDSSFKEKLKENANRMKKTINKQFSNVKRTLLKVSGKEKEDYCSTCRNFALVESGKLLLEFSYTDLS